MNRDRTIQKTRQSVNVKGF